MVKDKLAITAEAGVNFPVAVKVRGIVPGAVVVMQVEHGTLANVDEEAYILATPIGEKS